MYIEGLAFLETGNGSGDDGDIEQGCETGDEISQIIMCLKGRH